MRRLDKRVLVMVVIFFTFAISVYLLIIICQTPVDTEQVHRTEKNGIGENRFGKSSESIECYFIPILKHTDIARAKEIFKELVLIDRDLSTLIAEKTDIKLITFYIQENYPNLYELQAESMKILANINHPFSISITEPIFFSNAFLDNVRFIVDEKTKEALARFVERGDANRIHLAFVVQPLLVMNLKLFLLQGKHEESQCVLELSSQVHKSISEITSLALVIKVRFLEVILDTYELHKNLLSREHVAQCDLYAKELLRLACDAIFKYAVALKHNVNALIPYCRTTTVSDDKFTLFLEVERFLDSIVANSSCCISIDDYDKIKNLHYTDLDYDYGILSEAYVLVDAIKRYNKMKSPEVDAK